VGLVDVEKVAILRVMNTKAYPTDLTDAQWLLIEPLLRQKPGAGRPRTVDLRRVLNALWYLDRVPCPWRMLPHDFPPKDTVFYYFAKWQKDGTWKKIHEALRQQVRQHEKPGEPIRTASIDSQSTHSAGAQNEVGFDAGKNRHGRKRHIIVDSLGLLLAVVVTAGNVTDAQAGFEAMDQLDAKQMPELKTFYADQSYPKEGFEERVGLFNDASLVVIRPEKDETGKKKRGFQKLPKRWLVERTFGWLSRQRRLSRSYEHTVESEVAFIRIGMIGLMLNRLHRRPNPNPFHYRKTA
jgi:putative transposase